MKIAVLLKRFNNNKKGTIGLFAKDRDCFVFYGFMISREAVEDSPELFRIEERINTHSVKKGNLKGETWISTKLKTIKKP